jgi:hypothetical protein
MLPESSMGLYWSIRGTVLCARHTNELDEARRAAESWTPLPKSSQGLHGTWYQCQRCSAEGTALAHRPTLSAPTESARRT